LHQAAGAWAQAARAVLNSSEARVRIIMAGIGTEPLFSRVGTAHAARRLMQVRNSGGLPVYSRGLPPIKFISSHEFTA
jgi:hypothetical protein